jgi:hypothetical protein
VVRSGAGFNADMGWLLEERQDVRRWRMTTWPAAMSKPIVIIVDVDALRPF